MYKVRGGSKNYKLEQAYSCSSSLIFIRELIQEKEMTIHGHYTSSTTMWADFLTKPVPRRKYYSCCNKFGLKLERQN